MHIIGDTELYTILKSFNKNTVEQI